MKNLGLTLDVEDELAEGIDSLPVGIALFDAQDRPRTSNQLYRKLVAAIPELPSPCATPRQKAQESESARVPGTAQREAASASTDHDLVVATADGAAHSYRLRDQRTRNGGTIRLLYDITERKAREADRHQLQRRFRDAIECLDMGVALYDAQDRLELFNRWYRGVFAAIVDIIKPGISFEQVMQAVVAHAQPANMLGTPEQWVRNRIAASRDGLDAHEVRLGDGRWIAMRECRTADGCTICTLTDVTARKLREDGLKAIVDNIAQAVLVVSDEGLVSAFNPRAIAMFGVAAADGAMVKKLEDFLPADFARSIWQWCKDPARSEAGAFEHQMIDGKVVVVRTNPMPNGGFVASFTDMTERAQSAQRLHQSQKMEALGMLVGGVAHEFNNLLTAIGGFSKLARRKLGDADFVRDCLDEVTIAADRAADLTQQMLAFGRKQPMEPQVFAASEVIRGLDRMLRSLLPATIDLSVEIAAEEVCIWIDPGQMSQVILNLVLNARDAMPEGGRLTIGLATAAAPPALRAGKAAGADERCVAFSVADTGTGIADNVLPRLFEPFFTTKEPGQGTGLGLSVAHSIVERLGGIIEVKTALGQGTTFRIYLPIVEPVLNDAEEAKIVLSSRNCETILLVEDEPGVRKFADAVLSSLGYRVLATPNAGDAVAMLAKSGAAPDLLLTDIVMPDQSGPQLAAALRARYPGLRVVFITGYAERSVGVPTELGGEDIVLRKPFPPDSLGETVRIALDGAKAAANSRTRPVGAISLPFEGQAT